MSRLLESYMNRKHCATDQPKFPINKNILYAQSSLNKEKASHIRGILSSTVKKVSKFLGVRWDPNPVDDAPKRTRLRFSAHAK